MRGSVKFRQGWGVQLLLEGPQRQLPVRIQSLATIGPPAKCNENGVLLADNAEYWFDSFVIFQGGKNAKETYIFVIFREGGGGRGGEGDVWTHSPLPHSGSTQY